MNRRIFPKKHINSFISLPDFGRCVTYIVLAKIRLRDPDLKDFEHVIKGIIYFQSLFLGFKIGKRLVVLDYLNNPKAFL